MNPQPIHLPRGNYYYRFASSSSPREVQLGSGWWLDFENYKKVETFASQNGYSIREAARLLLALPPTWTRVDLRIKALLVAPLKAYAGEGKPVRAAFGGSNDASAWIPTQHVKVCQLYIPGLLLVVEDRPRKHLYERAFLSPATQSLM